MSPASLSLQGHSPRQLYFHDHGMPHDAAACHPPPNPLFAFGTRHSHTHTHSHSHTHITFIAPHADSLGPHSPARSLSIRVAVPGSRGAPRVCSSRPSRASCGSRAHGAIARADSAPSLTTHLDLLAPSGAAPVTAAPIVIYTIPSSSCWSELLPPAHSCSYDAGLGAVRSLTLCGFALWHMVTVDLRPARPLRHGSRYSCSYRHLHDPELLVLVRITSACALVQL